MLCTLPINIDNWLTLAVACYNTIPLYYILVISGMM